MLGTVNPVDSLGLMRLWILTSIIPNIILNIYPYTHKRGQLLHCTPSPSKKLLLTTAGTESYNWSKIQRITGNGGPTPSRGYIYNTTHL